MKDLDVRSDDKEKNSVKYWMAQISAAKDREKEYRKDSKQLVSLYEAGKKRQFQFNILYSNTETIGPAVYNVTPRPVVQQKQKPYSAVGAAAANTLEQTLRYFMDAGNEDYFTFDELITSAVIEALVPGRGVTRFKYEAEVEMPGEEEISESGELQQLKPPKVSYEAVCGEPVPWDRFLHGYAKKWKDVSWISIEHQMTEDELVDNFEEIGRKVKTAEQEVNGDASNGEKRTIKTGEKTATVYEIWDKRKKRVIFISDGYPDGLLKEPVEDPLKISGFFPVPEPLTFVSKISDLTPVPLYSFYEEQAKELNAITLRINKIIHSLKVRGFYDSSIQGIDRVLEADDNKLIPADNVAALQQGMSLEKSIFLMPIDKLVTVLQQLTQQREEIKGIIYEIMGIGDILRGASAASETATAQSLKDKWGGIRIKKQQKAVILYVRNCLRIMGEIAAQNFSVKTFAECTGLEYPTSEDKQRLQQLAQLGQSNPQLAQMIPPEQIQAGQALLQKPSWEDIVKLLQSGISRNCQIDIETNSTVDIESTEDKQNVAEFMNAFSQLLNGLAPLIEGQIMPFDAAKAVMLAVVRKFRFGEEVIEQIAAMKQPPPPKDPNEGKGQMEMQKQQMQLESDQKIAQLEAQIELQKQQGLSQLEMQKHQFEQMLNQSMAEVDSKNKAAIEQLKGAIQLELATKNNASAEKIKAAELAVHLHTSKQKENTNADT